MWESCCSLQLSQARRTSKYLGLQELICSGQEVVRASFPRCEFACRPLFLRLVRNELPDTQKCHQSCGRVQPLDIPRTEGHTPRVRFASFPGLCSAYLVSSLGFLHGHM